MEFQPASVSTRVVLARHGETLFRRIKIIDILRPLNAAGIASAKRLRAQMEQSGLIPTTFIVSPALRTLQTAWVLAKGRKAKFEIRFRLWRSSSTRVARLIDGALRGPDLLCIVGHSTPLLNALAYLAPRYTKVLDPRKIIMAHGAALGIVPSTGGPLVTGGFGPQTGPLRQRP